jgi:TPR repeat protein
MVIPGIRALTLLRSLPPLLLALAFPASADIDTSILRSQSKAGGAPKSAAAAPAAAGQPAATSEESPNDWYQRAVAFDRPGASGNDLPRASVNDLASAAYWYQKAAEKGHTDAQTNLAAMYAEGRGVDFNSLESARWYRKAAEAGNVRAQYSLAIMHWYESAARQGDANAMNNLAFMHGMGEGVVQSNVEAYVWFSLAASRGNADAAENRDLAAAEMTPEERRKARQRYTQLEEQLGL